MLWTCRVCRSADNRGLHKHCTNCGKPKDERDVERFPEDLSEDNALSGEDVREALAGPDWKCKFCGTLQNSLGRCCAECGCDKETGEKPWRYSGPGHITEDVDTGRKSVTGVAPTVVERRFTKSKAAIDVDPFRAPARTDEPVVTPREPAEPPRPKVPRPAPPEDAPERVFAPNTGGYRDPPAVEAPVEREFVPNTGSYRDPPQVFIPKTPLHRRPGVRRGAAVLAVALFTVLTLWLIFRTKVVDAKVTAVSWQHDVIVDRYQVYRKEGWDSDPGAFEVHDEGRRVHHYDHVKVGSHRESYQESYTCGQTCRTIKGSCTRTPRTCTSNKNGTATCTGGDNVCSPDTESCTPKTCTRTAYRTVDDYEDQPRYRTWYSWKVWEWGYNRTVRAAGSSMETRWPSDAELQPPGLAPGEQERHRRAESYSVTFSDSKDSWTVKPKSEGDFQRFPPGSRFKLKVGIANGVTVLGANGSSDEY